MAFPSDHTANTGRHVDADLLGAYTVHGVVVGRLDVNKLVQAVADCTIEEVHSRDTLGRVVETEAGLVRRVEAQGQAAPKRTSVVQVELVLAYFPSSLAEVEGVHALAAVSFVLAVVLVVFVVAGVVLPIAGCSI